MNLDRTDIELLRALQNNARLTNKELASRVHLAPSTCLERVRRLQARGILLGAHAEVDRKSLGLILEALISVRLQPNSRDHISRFMAHLEQLDEVQAAWHVSGDHDFLVHVVAPGPGELRDLILDQFSSRTEVAHIETALIFQEIRRHQLPYPAVPTAPSGSDPD